MKSGKTTGAVSKAGVADPRPAQDLPQREEIVALARRRWQEAGSPSGRDEQFWLAAENELKQQSANTEETARGDDRPAVSTPS